MLVLVLLLLLSVLVSCRDDAGAAIDESRRRRKKSAGTFKGKLKGGKLKDRLKGPTAIYDLACGKLRLWSASVCLLGQPWGAFLLIKRRHVLL